MSDYLKVTITLVIFISGSKPLISTEILFTSRRFYSYNLRNFTAIKESKGFKAVSFLPEPLTDSDIIECVNLKERNIPEEFAYEGLRFDES